MVSEQGAVGPLFKSRSSTLGGGGGLFTVENGEVLWFCYITVDSAMAASQNGFCSYKLSIHKKTNIMQVMRIYIYIYILRLGLVAVCHSFCIFILFFLYTIQ